MAKKYGLCALILFLAAHGNVLSMMHSKKLLSGYGNTIKLSRLHSDSTKKIDPLERIAQSLENIERRLEKQNKILALNIMASMEHAKSWETREWLNQEIYGPTKKNDDRCCIS